MDEYVKKSDLLRAVDIVMRDCGCELVPKLQNTILKMEGTMLELPVGSWKYIGTHFVSLLYCCTHCGGLERFEPDGRTPHLVRPYCRCGAKMVASFMKGDST